MADVVPLPNLVGGISTTETFFANHASDSAGYYLIGLYDETNKLLTIGMYPDAAAALIGQTDFNSKFSPFTKNDIATALLNDDTATLASFAHSPTYSPVDVGIGGSGVLVNFSNASDGGSVSAILIPEPSPSFLTGFGALAILGFHRRRFPMAQSERKGRT